MIIVCQTISNGYFIQNTNTGWFLFLRLFSILTLLIIKIEFWYQKSLFNFYMRQISDRVLHNQTVPNYKLFISYTCGSRCTKLQMI